ncbi:MAG: hypothetical protein LBL07_00265 [Tannerella sp.]|jgi:hypothetical protein|nr:hypothetical protein [Tannerella sp.]
MVKDKPKVQSVLESVFVNAVDKLMKADAGCLVDDLYVRLDMVSGEIEVYNDREVLLEKNIIFDWANSSENGMRSNKPAVNSIRATLAGLKSRKFFDNPVFMRPFRVLLTDDNFYEIETIFILGEDSGYLEGRLMKNLEQELQNFSKKLFADTE